jgi:MFS family permease
MKASVNFDWWLMGICSSRAFSQVITMTYAAALPVLLHEWGMSAVKAGVISSGFQIGYGISLLIMSILADRIGARILYLWSMFAGAVFSLGFAFFARDYLSALILYTFVALSLGGSYTTGLMLLAGQYPRDTRGKATGFFIASSSLANVLSLALSGITIPFGGYRLSFLVAGIATVLGWVLSWITLARTRFSEVKHEEEQSFKREVLANKPARLLIMAYTSHCWELLGMWAWAPAFLASCLAFKGVEGLGATGLGSYVAAAFHGAGLFASLYMGSLSDRLGRARVILVASGVSALCSFVFGWSLGWPFVIVILLGLLYAFSALGDSPVLSVALTEVVSHSYLGAAFGFRSLLGFGAGAISPVVFGAVLDWTNPITPGGGYYQSWGWAFVTLGLPGFGAVWAAYRLSKLQI